MARWPLSARKRNSIRAALRDRDGDDCHLCRGLMVFGNPANPDYATIDHVKPRSHGGQNGLSNLKLAHRRCNQARGDQGPESVWQQGMLTCA